MGREGGTGRQRHALAAGLLMGSLVAAGPLAAVDLREDWSRGETAVEVLPPLPRYFPREDGDRDIVAVVPLRRRVAGCIPRRAPVPTNAPDDPSYVGSTYGLGKPSYYGLTPPLGVDDPFGRPLLRYCP
jgi:hypothetical protein